MKRSISGFVLLLGLLALGCKTAAPAQAVVVDPPKTPLSKDALTERLAKKGVVVRPPRTADIMKPNPLMLVIEFNGSPDRFNLNREDYDSFPALLKILKDVRADREKNGVTREGTNEIEMTLTFALPAKKIEENNAAGIVVEDFEKLIDELKNEGFDKFDLTFGDEFDAPEEFSPGSNNGDSAQGAPGNNSNSGSGTDGTVSGGILNGKAVNLVKPPYPAAARAVRASGAVNVQVMIDEKGDVISATAVSGHPLLRASAVAAARSSKFNPTLLAGKPVKVSGVLVFNFQP